MVQSNTEVNAEEDNNGGQGFGSSTALFLLAFRKVLQVSTAFYPFKLLYGRKVRGPLDMMKEAWELDEGSS